MTHGRLIVLFPNDMAGACSATIVPSATEDLIITAAHCLADESGVVPEGAAFAPGYRSGEAPFGFWNATAFSVTDQWEVSAASGRADTRYDIGALKIAPDSQGTTLSDAFGSRGIQFNQDWQQTFTSFGYPSAPPFDGEKLYSCRSTAEDYDNLSHTTGPFPMLMGCDMTQGSSGGGWVIGDAFVNSVISYAYEFEPEVQFGPYFGSAAQAFYEQASGLDLPETPEPVIHPTRLSFSLSRHLIATGAVTAPDGYLPCTRRAPIEVFRKTVFGWRFVKETLTDSEGRYRMALPDKPGRYAAQSPHGEVDSLNDCAVTASFVKSHRH